MTRAKISGLVFSVLVLLAVTARALITSYQIPFQGKLLTPSTNLPVNGTVNLKFSFYNAPSGGTAIFSETQNSVPVANGVFSVQIGTITALPSSLFAGTSVYLGVTVNADAEMSPRQQLAMSPYAFTAMQLSNDQNIVVNPGTNGAASSTFTTTGNLQVPFGVSAATGVFSGPTFSVGTASFTVTGGSVTVAYGLTASSASFTAVSNTTFALSVSSGLVIASGTLDMNGSGGISNTYGIVSATGVFTAADSTWTIVSSSGMEIDAGELKIGTSSMRVLYDSASVSALGISSNVAVTGFLTSQSSITAAQFFGVGASSIAAKTAIQNVTSNTTLANDADLGLPIGANMLYELDGVLLSSSTSSTPGIKIAFSVPASATLNVAVTGSSTPVTFATNMLRASAVSSSFTVTANVINPLFFRGTVQTAGTAGSIILQWAQNVSNATATSLTPGSCMRASRIK